MRVMGHTEQTLRYVRILGLLMSLGLSVALFAPTFVGPIFSAMALTSALGISALRKRMTTDEVDFSLVSKAERHKFLTHNTAWLVVTLAGYGSAFALVFTSLPFLVRASLGHTSLLIGVMAAFMMGKTAMAHHKRVIVSPVER